jgi:hypothetical protein
VYPYSLRLLGIGRRSLPMRRGNGERHRDRYGGKWRCQSHNQTDKAQSAQCRNDDGRIGSRLKKSPREAADSGKLSSYLGDWVESQIYHWFEEHPLRLGLVVHWICLPTMWMSHICWVSDVPDPGGISPNHDLSSSGFPGPSLTSMQRGTYMLFNMLQELYLHAAFGEHETDIR